MSTAPSPSDPAQAAAAAVFRRLVRALGDLSITPTAADKRAWVSLDGELVAFGGLDIMAAARLANALEDLALRVGAPCAMGADGADDDTTSSDFVPTPDPVSSPFEPGVGSSRVHPRMYR